MRTILYNYTVGVESIHRFLWFAAPLVSSLRCFIMQSGCFEESRLCGYLRRTKSLLELATQRTLVILIWPAVDLIELLRYILIAGHNKQPAVPW